MALKNNNPGNIRSFIKNGKYSTPFVGESLPPDIKPGSTAGFRRFTTLAYGYRALFKILKEQYLEKGFNTIEKIFPRYAPSTDFNDPAAYIAAVEKMTGYNRSRILTTYQELIPVVKAITKVETGTTADETQVLKGLSLVGTYLMPSNEPDTTPGTTGTETPETFFQANKKKILISAAILIGGGLLIYYYGSKRNQ